MAQLGFYINQSICTGCKACQIACKDKNNNKVGINFRRVSTFENGTAKLVNGVFVQTVENYAVSISCNHCDEPKCVKACPTGAMNKDSETGVVSVDHTVCVGCKYCTWNCPYGAPQYNDELGMMTKCDMCMDLQQNQEQPACVNACPMGAIEVGDIEELRKKYGSINVVEGLPNPNITKPNIVITPHRFA